MVGLLVGMTMGLLVLAAGAHMLAQLMKAHRLALQDAHLQQDMHFALEVMIKELQSAQYAGQAWASRSPVSCEDPFCDAADFERANNVLGFSMDRNGNGVQDSNECLGYRVAEGVLSMRTGCHSSSWQPLTDKNTAVVTRLKTDLLCHEVDGWLHRQLLVEIDAHWPGDALRRLQLERNITLRNHLPATLKARFCP